MADKYEANLAIANLRKRHSTSELRRHFVDRTLDGQFDYIGRQIIESCFKPPHYYVWEGFAAVISSPYSEMGMSAADITHFHNDDN